MSKAYMLLAWAIMSLCIFGIGSANATTPWVPIVKDGSLQATGHSGTVDLQGISPVSFHFIRDQVKASTDPSTVELRPDYGAIGTRKELSTFADDALPISENDYYWQSQSPIYWNPNQDYYWGFQTYDLETNGQTWQTPIPQRYDEWYGNSYLSWDKDQIALDIWANQKA